jgi:putative ABC transport system substrate-binding protein
MHYGGMTSRMTRRQHLKELGRLGTFAGSLLVATGCAALPLVGQPSRKTPRIGYLALGSSPSSLAIDTFQQAFRDGLRELGYVEGQTIRVEWRSANGQADQLPALAANLAQLPVDVIVAADIQAIQAASQATSVIPIVMTLNGDPVRTGLVASLAQPGGNITGLTSMSVGASGKRVELLKEAVTTVSRGVVVWNGTVPDRALDFKDAQDAARSLGIEIKSLEVRGPDDLGPAFAEGAAWGPDSLFLLADALTIAHADDISSFALQHRLPSICEGRLYVTDNGGLMAYGPSQPDLYRRAATYVDKILKGARPAGLPVEQPTKFDFVVSLRTARALGLTIPQSILIQATELIQ